MYPHILFGILSQHVKKHKTLSYMWRSPLPMDKCCKNMAFKKTGIYLSI